MALITTTEKLKEYIPSLVGLKEDEENSLYKFFKQDLENANAFIKNELLGETIYNKLNDFAEIKALATAIEAYKGAEVFIPQSELVLTENGFAVMGTNEQSPASKERVERLISAMKENLALSIESIQILIENNEVLRADWQGVKYCSYFPEFICNSNRIFMQFAVDFEGSSLLYSKLKPAMIQSRSYLIKKFGYALYQDLIVNPESEKNQQIIYEMRTLFAGITLKQNEIIKKNTTDLFSFLVKNKADYPLFADFYGTPEKWENLEDNRVTVLGVPRL